MDAAPRAVGADAAGADLDAGVRAWITANWDLSITVRTWWHRLFAAGLPFPTWPEGLGGRGAGNADARVVELALAAHGVIGPPVGALAVPLAAPTIFAHGTPAQIERLIPAIATGEAAWCQLFSEPGAGSDLAGLATRAVRDGDEYVVTGQKVWSSSADVADMGMLLARTDLTAPKHRGITYFALDLHQPGVEVRPLREMSGATRFCEVFLTEARVPADAVIGGPGEGWRVAQTTMRAERGAFVSRGPKGLVTAASGRAGDLDRPVGEIVERASRARSRSGASANPRQGASALPAATMVDLARSYGRAGDPTVRQEVARYWSQVKINGWVNRRIAATGGRLTGADGSLAKLAMARVCQQSRELSYLIVGADGLAIGPSSPLGGQLQHAALASPGARIGGGTDEIQLNVLAEKALGLPREPDADWSSPTRTVPAGPAT